MMVLHCYILPQLWSNVQYPVRSSTLTNDLFLELICKKSSFSLFSFNGRQKTPHNSQGWAAASCSKIQHCLCKLKSELKPMSLVLLHLVLTEKTASNTSKKAKNSGAASSTTHTKFQFPQRIWWMLSWQIFSVWNPAKLSKVNHIIGSTLQFTPLGSQGWCHDHYFWTISHVSGPARSRSQLLKWNSHVKIHQHFSTTKPPQLLVSLTKLNCCTCCFRDSQKTTQYISLTQYIFQNISSKSAPVSRPDRKFQSQSHSFKSTVTKTEVWTIIKYNFSTPGFEFVSWKVKMKPVQYFRVPLKWNHHFQDREFNILLATSLASGLKTHL